MMASKLFQTIFCIKEFVLNSFIPKHKYSTRRKRKHKINLLSFILNFPVVVIFVTF